jgi:hypothetical protein
MNDLAHRSGAGGKSHSRRARIVTVILVNVLVLFVLLGAIEVTARLLFPAFQNQVFSDHQTAGIFHHFSRQPLGWDTRVPRAGEETNKETDRLVVVLGDSISRGYATAYEDIYWVQLARMMGAAGSHLRFVSPSAAGNTLEDSLKALEEILKRNHNVAFVLYQFNQNDILTVTRESLKSADRNTVRRSRFWDSIATWRYEFLNHSVASRTLQHFGGVLIRRTRGSCEDRGIDALGQYTFSYGARPYAELAKQLWSEFDERLLGLSRRAAAQGIGFAVFLSPILPDIDKQQRHPYSPAYNLDFSCATIDPHSRLKAFSERNGIAFFDPTDYMRQGFENRLAEGNFTPFFFPADDNHFTPTAGRYLADYLFMKLHATIK